MAKGFNSVTAILYVALAVNAAVHLLTSAASVNHFRPVPAPFNYCPCRCCLLPHPDNCKSYYLCLENLLYQRECEDGELFNKLLENCDYQERVHCEMVTPEPLVLQCLKREGLFPHPTDCGSFIQCSNWIPYVHRCPANLHFSAELERCEYPSTAKCSTAQTYITGLPTGSLSEGNECPARDGMFSYYENSSLYLQCEDWLPKTRYCPPDTHYSAARWICTIKNIEGQ